MIRRALALLFGAVCVVVAMGSVSTLTMTPAAADTPQPSRETPPRQKRVPITDPYYRSNVSGNLAKIAAPTNVTYTNDPAECTRRLASGNGGLISGLLCGPIISSGQQLMLLWSWSPCSDDPHCAQQIDGYNVYVPRGTGSTTRGYMLYDSARRYGPLKPISTVNRQDTPETFLKTFHAGECFAVTAFKGSIESPLSSPFCLPNNVAIGIQPVGTVLTAARLRSSWGRGSRNTGVVDTMLRSIYAPRRDFWFQQLGIVHVGYAHDTDKSIAGDESYNEIWRGALWFDLAPLQGKTLTRAVLHLHVHQTFLGVPSQDNYYRSCSSDIGLANRDWWDDTGWLEGSFYGTLPYPGPEITVDLKSIVQDWLSGATPNYGLVLKGPDENMGAFTESQCETVYDTPTLDVEYY